MVRLPQITSHKAKVLRQSFATRKPHGIQEMCPNRRTYDFCDEDDDFVVVLRLAQKPDEVRAEVEPLVVQVLAVDHTLRVPGDAAVDGGEVGFPVDPAAVFQ